MKHDKLTCYYCKGKFPREDLIQMTTKKRSCKPCYDKAKAKKVKNDIKQIDDISYPELIDYICKGFGISKPTGKQLNDIKKFKSLGYSHRDIQWTIYYIESVVGRRLNCDLGLIPYYYAQAIRHFEIVKKNEQFIDDMQDVKEVIIKRPNKDIKPRVDKTRFIDIDNIF